MRLSSVPSIEETGLDAALYGEQQSFLTPRESARAERNSPVGAGSGIAKVAGGRTRMTESKADEAFVDAVDAVQDEGKQKKRKKKALHNKMPADDDLKLIENPETPTDAISSRESEEDVARVKTEEVEAPGSMEGEVMRKETTAEVWERLGIDRKRNVSPDEATGRIPSTEEMRELQFFNASSSGVGNPRGNDGVERKTKFALKNRDRLSGIDEGTAEEGNSQELPPPHQASVQSQQGEDGLSEMLCSPTPILGVCEPFISEIWGQGF